MGNVVSKLCWARRNLSTDLASRVMPISLRRYSRVFDLFAEFAGTLEIDGDWSEQEAIEYVIHAFRESEQLSKNYASTSCHCS